MNRQAAFRSDRGQELYLLGLAFAAARGHVDARGRVCNPARGIVKSVTDRALAEWWGTAAFVADVQRCVVRAEKRRRPGAVRE